VLTQRPNPKFNDTQHYMKLKWNLYRCKQAARNWFWHLTGGLLKLGFIQSKTDCVLVVYIDDCLIFTEHDDIINNLIAGLSKSFLLQDEGDVSAFLGVQIHKDPISKMIMLTQLSLIQQILHDVSITSQSNGKDTPANSILYADLQVQIVLRDGITDQLLASSIISPITHGQILVWPCTNVPDFFLTPKQYMT
jgi:hypothetical protein